MNLWKVSLKGEPIGRLFYSLEEAEEFYNTHENSAALWREDWAFNAVFPVPEHHDTIIKEKEITLERIKIDVTN